MRKSIIASMLALGFAALAAANAAAQNDSAAQAEYWGKLHGGAIYCKIATAHEFGLAAVKEFKRIGKFETLREIYGVAMLNAANLAPGSAVGGSCDGLRKRYDMVFDMLKGESR